METVKQNSARDFFLHLLSIVTLYMSTVSLLVVVFQIIQYFVPDVLDTAIYFGSQDAVRTPVAILFIAFPIYAWSVWYLAKLVKNNPELAEFRLRKWLMYLTVFVSAIAMIVTMITVVYNFLNGDLTLRFFLQVFSVLLVSGMAFYYYLVTVKQEGNKMVLHGVEVVTVIFVVLTIFGSFFVMGSPKEQRERRIDNQRVSALQNIDTMVQEYFSANKKTLPESLDVLFEKTVPNLRIDTDPVTDEQYVYEKTGTSTYKLCATFTMASYEWEMADRSGKSQALIPYYGAYNWVHDIGTYCFDRVIEPYRIETVTTEVINKY